MVNSFIFFLHARTEPCPCRWNESMLELKRLSFPVSHVCAIFFRFTGVNRRTALVMITRADKHSHNVANIGMQNYPPFRKITVFVGQKRNTGFTNFLFLGVNFYRLFDRRRTVFVGMDATHVPNRGVDDKAFFFVGSIALMSLKRTRGSACWRRLPRRRRIAAAPATLWFGALHDDDAQLSPVNWVHSFPNREQRIPVLSYGRRGRGCFGLKLPLQARLVTRRNPCLASSLISTPPTKENFCWTSSCWPLKRLYTAAAYPHPAKLAHYSRKLFSRRAARSA